MASERSSPVPPRLANGHILPTSEGGFCALAQFVRKNTKKAPEAHSPTPIGQGHRRGDAHIVGYYAPRKQACLTGGLGHRDGAERDKGPERPSRTPALFPLPQKRCGYYSGIAPRQSEESEPPTVGVVGELRPY